MFYFFIKTENHANHILIFLALYSEPFSVYNLWVVVRSQDLEIIPEGDMHKVAEGKNIVLTCQVNHLQDAKLKWFDQTMEQIIETNGRSAITQSNILLYWLKVRI